MIQFEIQNQPLKEILLQITTYRSRHHRKITCKTVGHEKKTVNRGEVTKWEPNIQIPALPPTGLGGCSIIDVRFLLEVSLSINGRSKS